MPWKESSTLNEREKFVKAMAVWFGEFHIGNIDLITVSLSIEGVKL